MCWPAQAHDCSRCRGRPAENRSGTCPRSWRIVTTCPSLQDPRRVRQRSDKACRHLCANRCAARLWSGATDEVGRLAERLGAAGLGVGGRGHRQRKQDHRANLIERIAHPRALLIPEWRDQMLHWQRHTRATRLYVGVRELNNLTKPDIDAVSGATRWVCSSPPSLRGVPKALSPCRAKNLKKPEIRYS